MMNLQYISDKSGHTTAVQIQIPIEEWDVIKKKYKDFEEEENAASINIPDWHEGLVRKELENVKNGTAGLVDWQEARKNFKL